jgi:hypothetical protein
MVLQKTTRSSLRRLLQNSLLPIGPPNLKFEPKILVWVAMSLALYVSPASAQTSKDRLHACRIQETTFEGWKAEQIANRWVKVIIVPQLGGRVMQVYFDGHPYLFVNPKYKGQYVSPAEAAKGQRWINYGGDKIWPMPEGEQDEHHWPGPISDALDDGEYKFSVVTTSPVCKVRLDGPSDARTGLQYSREITVAGDAPEIRFHAIMKNVAEHPIQWSMQSVTQYDTGDAEAPDNYNQNFWAYTPVNSNSGYMDGYHVRWGLVNDPSFRIENGLFSLHWRPLGNEVWLDSTAGWLTVVDATAQYGMIERFHYAAAGEYPGKATVIFYKNGSMVELNEKGFPELGTGHGENSPRYMEAELNSPIVSLAPGETYAMDTEWYPVRIGGRPASVTDVGVCTSQLQATRVGEGVLVSGACSVFVTGRLEARWSDAHGVKAVALEEVDPARVVELRRTIAAVDGVTELAIHLIDTAGKDRGALGSATVLGAK